MSATVSSCVNTLFFKLKNTILTYNLLLQVFPGDFFSNPQVMFEILGKLGVVSDTRSVLLGKVFYALRKCMSHART